MTVKRDSDRDLEFKRLALQLAVQLPKDPGEALRVLTFARVLVVDYMMTSHEEPEGRVMPFKRQSDEN